MIWFRPTRRACYGYWFLSPTLQQIDMSTSAAKAIYAIFNLCPVQMQPVNDKDAILW